MTDDLCRESGFAVLLKRRISTTPARFAWLTDRPRAYFAARAVFFLQYRVNPALRGPRRKYSNRLSFIKPFLPESPAVQIECKVRVLDVDFDTSLL
jgi:hypothetical protein